MRPRTKLQVEVINLSSRLSYISKPEKDWATQNCLDHRGLATKNKVNCMDCGEYFHPSIIVRKTAICPHCEIKLKIITTKKRTDSQSSYFAIAEIVGDFQVIRNFEIEATYKSGHRKSIRCFEILQHWILENGKREVVAMNHKLNYSQDYWHGNMEIRDKSNKNNYDVYPYKFHPESEFKPCYKKYGINHNLSGVTFLESISFIPNESKAETILKAKQYSLLGYMYNNRWKISRYWPSIKICLRNKKIIIKPNTFIDYLQLLEYFNRDILSPKYLFPKNLEKEHDRLVVKKREKQKKEDAKKRIERIKKHNDEYQEQKKSFLGMKFSEGDLLLNVIDNVYDFMKEGDLLGHCLFTNEYYKKQDSLILSAKVSGEIVETVEFSLETMKIIQSRGKGNQATEHNSRIINLININIYQIKNRLAV